MKNKISDIYIGRGFTLIEMIIVIVVLSIVSVGASMLLVKGFGSYNLAQNTINSQQQAQIALELMTRDLRAIRSSSDISIAASNNIVFVDVNGNTIDYKFFSATKLLQRKIGSVGTYQSLANNVQDMTISYYDATGASATQNTLIRYIVISVTISIDNIPFTLKVGVYPWNLN